MAHIIQFFKNWNMIRGICLSIPEWQRKDKKNFPTVGWSQLSYLSHQRELCFNDHCTCLWRHKCEQSFSPMVKNWQIWGSHLLEINIRQKRIGENNPKTFQKNIKFFNLMLNSCQHMPIVSRVYDIRQYSVGNLDVASWYSFCWFFIHIFIALFT